MKTNRRIDRDKRTNDEAENRKKKKNGEKKTRFVLRPVDEFGLITRTTPGGYPFELY